MLFDLCRLHEEQYATMTHVERMALQTAGPRSRLPVMFSPACKEHEISDADHTILASHIGHLRFTDVRLLLLLRPSRPPPPHHHTPPHTHTHTRTRTHARTE